MKTLAIFKKNTLQNDILLVIDTTLVSDNPLSFRENLLEGIKIIIMAIDDKIRDEKLQYDVDREVVKILALSSGKIDKYEYLTDEEILLLIEAKLYRKLGLLILL